MALNVRSASAAMTIQTELAFRDYRCRRLALAYYGSLAFSGGKPPTTRKAQSQEHRTDHCKYFFHLPPILRLTSVNAQQCRDLVNASLLMLRCHASAAPPTKRASTPRGQN